MSREFWMAWSDTDGGYLVTVYGISTTRKPIAERIARETSRTGNRFGVRPVRVTVHNDVDSVIRPL